MPTRPATVCPTCRLPTCHHRTTPTRPSSAEQKRRRQAVAGHVNSRGWNCPGWNTAPHASRDLTADHVQPRSLGGEHGPLRVLCRSCNSRRGNTPTEI